MYVAGSDMFATTGKSRTSSRSAPNPWLPLRGTPVEMGVFTTPPEMPGTTVASRLAGVRISIAVPFRGTSKQGAEMAWLRGSRRIGARQRSLLAQLSTAAILVSLAALPASAHTSDSATPVRLGATASIHSPSVTLGADGLTLIAFLTGANELKVAKCLDDACIAPSVSTLSKRANSFGTTSIAVGNDGLAVIAFTDPSERLSVAHCGNSACSSARVTTVDDGTFSPIYSPRITVGSNGPIIVGAVTASPFTSQLVLRACADPSCKTSSTRILDPNSHRNAFAVTTNRRGFPLVAYVRALPDHKELVVTDCGDQTCDPTKATSVPIDASPVVSTIDMPMGVSVQQGGDSLGLIAYYDGVSLKAIHCVIDPCAVATTSVLSASAASGPSLAIGTDDNGKKRGLIAYLQADLSGTTYTLEVLHCEDEACVTTHSGGAIPTKGAFSLGATRQGRGFLSYVSSLLELSWVTPV